MRIAEFADMGLEFLKSHIDSKDEDRARAAIFGLAGVRRAEQVGSRRQVVPLLIERLGEEERPLVLAELIDSLAFLGDERPAHLITGLEGHESPYVRGAALRYRARVFGRSAMPVLLQALADASYLVRETAVDELDRLGVAEALPLLRNLESDPHPDVREAVQSAVAHLITASTD